VIRGVRNRHFAFWNQCADYRFLTPYVAQAMVERIPIISGDPVLDPYSVKRLW